MQYVLSYLEFHLVVNTFGIELPFTWGVRTPCSKISRAPQKQRSCNTPVAKADSAELVSGQGQSQVLPEPFALVLSQSACSSFSPSHIPFHSQSWHANPLSQNLRQPGGCLATAQGHSEASSRAHLAISLGMRGILS